MLYLVYRCFFIRMTTFFLVFERFCKPSYSVDVSWLAVKVASEGVHKQIEVSMGKCSIDSMNPIARRRRKSHPRQTTLILMRRKIQMRRTARRVYVEDMCCIHGIDWKLSLSCPKNYCLDAIAHVMILSIPRLGVLFDIVRHRSEWDMNGSEMWNVYMQIYTTDKSLQHHDWQSAHIWTGQIHSLVFNNSTTARHQSWLVTMCWRADTKHGSIVELEVNVFTSSLTVVDITFWTSQCHDRGRCLRNQSHPTKKRIFLVVRKRRWGDCRYCRI